MLIAVRHGKTAMNEDGKERLRGWLPITLTLEGMKSSRDNAELLSELEDVKKLYSSDLVRAVQSATEVAQVLWMEIEIAEELRDWNYGYLTGQLTSGKNLNELNDFVDNPDKSVKEGEPFQSFLDRAVPFLTKLVESDDLFVAVTHNRTITLLAALCANKGKYPDIPIMKKPGPIDPSGIMIVSSDWKIVFKTAKDKIDRNT